MSTMAGNPELNQDFKEFIALLNENEVRYLVVGGYAVALHGHPRYTKDLDIWLDISEENAESVIKALDAFGFGSLDFQTADFTTPDQVVQLGRPPRRIDLITTIPGVNFDKCYKSKVAVDIDGVIVNFIDVENLKKNKRVSARPQDIADVDNLP